MSFTEYSETNQALLFIFKYFLCDKGPVRGRHAVPGREMRLAAATARDPTAGRAGARDSAPRAAVRRAAARRQATARARYDTHTNRHNGT